MQKILIVEFNAPEAAILRNTKSLFSQVSNLAENLLSAETDKEDAARLGGKTEDSEEMVRTTEPANWLSYIQN